MTKLDILGKQRLENEKQKLRTLTDTTIKRCNENTADNFCQYFRKGELKFLDELRDFQTNKSLKLLNLYHNSLSEQNCPKPNRKEYQYYYNSYKWRKCNSYHRNINADYIYAHSS